MTMSTASTGLAAALAMGCLLYAAGGPAVDGREGAALIAVRAGKVYVGNGQVLEGALILVRDGKVLRLEKDTGRVPEGFEVVDARSRVVIPGLVMADTDLAAPEDDVYAVAPDLRALDGFDFEERRFLELSGGVTSVYLSPARDRLVSGLGAVVKLAGASWERRVLKEEASLRVAVSEEGKAATGQGRPGAPPVFEPVVSPSAYNPLLPARVQYPTARISQLAELRRVFASALENPPEGGGETMENGSDGGGNGPLETRYATWPLRRVLEGRLPLRIAARDAGDIRRAMEFARSFSTLVVLEDPVEAGRLADEIASAGMAAVLRMPIRPSDPNPGDLIPGVDDLLPDPATAAALARAGVRFALAPSDDGDLPEMLLLAGLAVRHGLDPERALASVTLEPARMLGVADRVGSLEPGRDADMVLLTGEPFDGRTVVDRVFVEGSEVFRRGSAANVLAVRAGRILTGDGAEIENGVVIIEDGRIVSVARGTSVPFGAEILDVPDGVVIPGMIDAASRLGLHAEGGANLRAGSEVDVSSVLVPGDPVFALALEEGITTVLVCGEDSGVRSGRVSAVKTVALDGDRARMVLRELAGLRFAHDTVGPQALRALRNELNRGKQYVDRFNAYEEALKASLEGKEAPEQPKPAPEPAEPDAVTGLWSGSIEAQPVPRPIEFSMRLRLAGDQVTGTLTLRLGPQPRDVALTGTFRGRSIKLTGTSPAGPLEMDGEVGEDEMSGKFSAGPLAGTFTAKRTGKDPAATAPSQEGKDEPAKPPVDQSLEPYRDLFAGRIPAVVRTSNGTVIGDVLKVFLEEFKLSLVLADATDAAEEPELLEGVEVGVQMGPNVVWRTKGRTVSGPARLANAGIPVAFQTEAAAGTRYLPVHALMAVRYGMDPDSALKALTKWPARMYNLDERIGTIARGKDGDLVVLSGDPFDLTTRVLAVVVEGRVVVDRRR